MFYWIYDVPPLWTVGLFAALFVGVCWIGVVLFRPFVRERLNPDARLNEILGDFLQYLGLCTACCSVYWLLRRTKIIPMSRRRLVARHLLWPRYIGM